jgi:flagella synthesis protein FlgN
MTVASPATTLTAERQLIASLTGLLHDEQRLLVSADTDALAQLTPQKAQLVQQLADQAAARHLALAAAGFEQSENGMAPWLKAHGSGEDRAQWEQLLHATGEAKELNRINGMLINKHMAHNQELLTALRTTASGVDATVYGPGGQTVGGGASKKFVLG